jgi:hypothetical protein
MKMKKKWLPILALVALVLPLLPAGLVWAQEEDVVIALQPSSGPPGTEVTISGHGAPPGGTVQILYVYWPEPIPCDAGRGADVLTEVTADAEGRFSATHRAERIQDDQVGWTYRARVIQPPPPHDRSNVVCFTFAPPETPADPAFFPETGFEIEHQPFAEYFRDRGGVQTFGYPASRTITFLGCTTQFFQRHLLQQCEGGPVQLLNLLDPGLMPVDQVNFSIFPSHDSPIAGAAPPADAPNYGQAVLAHLQATVPNTHEGLAVNFRDTFLGTIPDAGATAVEQALVNLEIWGFPTSQPAFDPNNRSFIYQRFQRGIMHFDASTGTTGGILLADWFKAVITGEHLPPDLQGQMQETRFYRQYCPENAQWLCRPDQLQGTELTRAFEPIQRDQ